MKKIMTSCLIYSVLVLIHTSLNADEHQETEASYILEYEAEQLPDSLMTKAKVFSQSSDGTTLAHATLTQDEVTKLAEQSNISIEPNYPLYFPQTNHSMLDQATNYNNLDYNQVQISHPYWLDLINTDALPEPSSPFKVCVIDSGVQTSHPDLPKSTTMGRAVFSGYHSAYAGFWHQDAGSHGTHLLGLMAAVNNDQGVRGVISNGNLQVHSQRLLNTFQGANSTIRGNDLINAIEMCANSGAKIINMSLGSDYFSLKTRDVIDRLTYSHDIIFVGSAGNHHNSQKPTDKLHFPASYHNVVSVGAVDKNKQRADFSAINDGLSIVAPGVELLSSINNAHYYVDNVTFTTKMGDTNKLNVFQIDSALTALPDSLSADEICHYQLPPNLVREQQHNEALSHIFKTQLDAKTRHCQNSGAKLLLLSLNDKSDTQLTSINFYTDFPTLLTKDTLNKDELKHLEIKVNNAHYAFASGTSQATALVTAGLAKLWALHPHRSRDDILHALYKTAEDLGVAGKDPAYGHGLVNFAKADTFLAQYSPQQITQSALCPATWYDNKAYQGGQKATYNGIIYQAKYWTKASVPFKTNSAPWLAVGQCAYQGIDETKKIQFVQQSFMEKIKNNGMMRIKGSYPCSSLTLQCSKRR